MSRPERVVFALRALGESGETAALTESSDPVAPSGQDLVRIGLMADVPDDPVRRRIEHIVQRHSQLDYAEAGAQMPARHRHCADGLGAQFIGDLREVALVQLPQIRGRIDLIQQRRERFRHFIPKDAAYLPRCPAKQETYTKSRACRNCDGSRGSQAFLGARPPAQTRRRSTNADADEKYSRYFSAYDGTRRVHRINLFGGKSSL